VFLFLRCSPCRIFEFCFSLAIVASKIITDIRGDDIYRSGSNPDISTNVLLGGHMGDIEKRNLKLIQCGWEYDEGEWRKEVPYGATISELPELKKAFGYDPDFHQFPQDGITVVIF